MRDKLIVKIPVSKNNAISRVDIISLLFTTIIRALLAHGIFEQTTERQPWRGCIILASSKRKYFHPFRGCIVHKIEHSEITFYNSPLSDDQVKQLT
jgi:hypothetical protein